MSGLLQDAIIGGQIARKGSAAAYSTVRIHTGASRCTGSIIADDMVITAAHCLVHKPDPGKLRVGFGVRPGSGGSVGVLDYRLQPNHRIRKGGYTGSAFDLAVIRIRGKIPKGFGPAIILKDSAGLEENDVVVTAGYGRTIANDPESGGILRVTKLLVKRHQNAHEIVLDSANGTATCTGDSGGPTFIEYSDTLFLFGVVSRGDEDCSFEEVHSRIDASRKWIEKTIKILREIPLEAL